MEYKLLCYQWETGNNRTNISTYGQTASRNDNPAIDNDLNNYVRQGWRVVEIVNNAKGGMFFLLER